MIITKKKVNIIKQTFRFLAKKRLCYCKRFALRDKILNRALKAYLEKIKAKSLLVYMPLDMEANILPLIFELRKKKYHIFMPFIQELSFKMIPFRLPFYKNQYGIFQSKDSLFKLIKVDTVIVPVLGVDRDFRRIGFGKGMYDRFMSSLKRKVRIIFVARSPNITLDVITEYYDVKGDYFFTPSALCKGKRNGMVCDRNYNLWYISRC